MSALLDIEAVTKTYVMRRHLFRPPSVLTAVDRVSLSIARGGALGIVGESGCGKSTLARLIMRLETPSSGIIRFDGVDIASLSGAALRPFRKRFQMVFQDPGGSLNPRKSVARVLAESLALAGVAAQDRARSARIVLDQVGLGAAMLDRHPHELSGGQRQRVAIARALVMRPELIVADEPVSALDVSLQAQIVRLLMRLRDDLGLTLLFISHDLALVHHLCDEIAVMRAGQVVERGRSADVLHSPRHPYTKQLLDAIPRGRRP